MKKLNFLSLVITIFLFSNSIFANPKESSFTSNQTKEIEKIVHDYLLKNPQILIEVSKKLEKYEEKLQKEKLEAIKANLPKYKEEIFDDKTPGRIVLGNPNGKIVIAEYTQHQCPHCKETSLILDKLIKENPEVKVIVIYWPFFGGDAVYTAKAVMAANLQKQAPKLNHLFFTEKEFLNKDKANLIMHTMPGLNMEQIAKDINSEKFSNTLKNNFILAQKVGIDGTPALIFTNKDMTKFSFLPGKTQNFDNDLKQALSNVQK